MRSHFTVLHRRNINALLVWGIEKIFFSNRTTRAFHYQSFFFPSSTSNRSSLLLALSSYCVQFSDLHKLIPRYLLRLDNTVWNRERELFFLSFSLVSEKLPEWKKIIHKLGVEKSYFNETLKSVEHRARNEKVAKILIRVIINFFSGNLIFFLASPPLTNTHKHPLKKDFFPFGDESQQALLLPPPYTSSGGRRNPSTGSGKKFNKKNLTSFFGGCLWNKL